VERSGRVAIVPAELKESPATVDFVRLSSSSSSSSSPRWTPSDEAQYRSPRNAAKLYLICSLREIVMECAVAR
jgi:hypothetical protein